MNERQAEIMITHLRSIDLKLDVALGAIARAEQEIPEYLRRAMMYYHDLIHVIGEWKALGHQAPKDLEIELERTHDRILHCIEDENQQGGTFERIRKEITDRGGHRYDHDHRRRRV